MNLRDKFNILTSKAIVKSRLDKCIDIFHKHGCTKSLESLPYKWQLIHEIIMDDKFKFPKRGVLTLTSSRKKFIDIVF